MHKARPRFDCKRPRPTHVQTPDWRDFSLTSGPKINWVHARRLSLFMFRDIRCVMSHNISSIMMYNIILFMVENISRGSANAPKRANACGSA